ncbi:MAG TPA: adenylate/guanylate cyclase domain-containing protein [Candidatus Binatia bacterium]|nr:adenylate/guanylate cyclase domain-containing protein [Candidatus Binatia bacterium]
MDTADLLVGLFAAGMGLAFFGTDPKSPTSRALAAFLVTFGVTFSLNVPVYAGLLGPDPWVWGRLFTLGETAAFVAAYEWLLRIRRTETTPDPHHERLLRTAQGLAGIYGALGLAFNGLMCEAFKGVELWRPAYYLFAVPVYLSLALAFVSTGQLLTANPDHSERARLLAFGAATPFLISGLFVPDAVRPVTTGVGEIIFLAGALHYHVLQGQRGQFLSRFLSPQVAHLVRERGLRNATQQSRIQLSVVACDLRGFTAFAETAAPEDVMQLLQEYYDAAGEAVTEYGGTIKDFAGDGILTLVGAPIPYPDHARRAVVMALKMRERGEHVLSRWQRLGLDVGLSVGIASGYVTVGAIGGERRLEYAAVGPPVNLAARLCAVAESSQILADQRTVGLIGENGGGYRFEKLDPVTLKGFARAVTVFAVNP